MVVLLSPVLTVDMSIIELSVVESLPKTVGVRVTLVCLRFGLQVLRQVQPVIRHRHLQIIILVTLGLIARLLQVQAVVIRHRGD